MKIPPVKGTRDFYPPQMAVRNWIIDGWKKASVRSGFEEYDGPIFEYLDMYRIKSGDEIVEQLFSFKDRGDRDLAIRPEITPTLARMVNQQINSLPKPIKWFSVPRLCRAERPQKGRLREFFQWNIDIIGEDSVLADAEVIFTTIDYLRGVGLTEKDIQVKVSSRKLLAAVLKQIGITEDRLNPMYALLDKKAKLPPETFDKILAEQVPDAKMAGKIQEFMRIQKHSDIRKLFKDTDELKTADDEMTLLFDLLNRMGIGEYVALDLGIVRGLAYYTGIVFEVHDIAGGLRAICGGGRYDNLLKDFGGPDISATGMGMGDCVLEILLSEKGLLKPLQAGLDYFVAAVNTPADVGQDDAVIKIVSRLRTSGYSADFSHRSGGLGRQLKEASERRARKCIIIGEEYNSGNLVVKDMASGNQQTIAIDEFFKALQAWQI